MREGSDGGIVRWLRGWQSFYRQVNDEATGHVGLFEWGVALTAAIALMVAQFGAQSSNVAYVVERAGLDLGTYWELAHLLAWVAACVVGYVVIPVVYLRVSGERLADYYLGFRGLGQHLGMYAALFLPASILVLWVSYWPDFQAIYPFYSLAGRSWVDLIAWELAYGVQFFAIEFFFRAFLLQSLRRSMGVGAILLMVLPYCMIHFTKTPAESVGSIFAGLILGMIAMRGRSIWGGVLLHWLIAIEMDVLSLVHKGTLPDWPL